jgi:hypothetical protein
VRALRVRLSRRMWRGFSSERGPLGEERRRPFEAAVFGKRVGIERAPEQGQRRSVVEHRRRDRREGAGRRRHEKSRVDADRRPKVGADHAHRAQGSLACVGSGREAVVEQHDIRGGAGDVGAERHGDPDIRRDQGGGVIDAIAHEGDAAALPPQAL